MDYLEELERRQAAALARLLVGMRTESETAETEDSTGTRTQTEMGRETVSRPGGEASTEAGRAVAETGASDLRRRETAASASTETAVWNGTLAEQAGTFEQTRRADALWRDSTSAPGSLPGVLLAERAMAVEVEDISRAVQRDARRYDGGFSIF